jgi:ribosomal protein L24
MGNNTKNPVTIDGVEYIVEDMTPEQQTLLNHVIDLERKLNSAKFNVDQLQVGRDAFFSLLKTALSPITDVQVKE